MAAGNWIPELTETLGAVNLSGHAGPHSPWMPWEDLVSRRSRRDGQHALRLRSGENAR